MVDGKVFYWEERDSTGTLYYEAAAGGLEVTCDGYLRRERERDERGEG